MIRPSPAPAHNKVGIKTWPDDQGPLRILGRRACCVQVSKHTHHLRLSKRQG